MKITEEQALAAPMIAYPFGLFDCCPTTDGAAAAILCRADIAQQPRQGTDPAAWLRAWPYRAANPISIPTCEYLGFPSTRRLPRRPTRLRALRIRSKQVDFAEVHDCFTWTEITNYEDLGFCGKGEGGKFIEEGRSSLQGDLPVNPSGGLKSFGHPVGATGVRMIYELTTQLRGQAGQRQVKDAELGLAHNLGGPGAVACVILLGREA